jgi:hypothetical protein
MLKIVLMSLFITFSISPTWARSAAVKSSSMKQLPSKFKGQKLAYYKRAETLSQTASSTTNDPNDEKLITATVNVSYSQSFVDRVDGNLKSSRTILAIISTKINDQWSLATRTALSQDLRDSESLEDGFSDLLFIAGKKPSELNDWLMGNQSFTVVAPVSEYSTRVQNSQGSLQAGYTFSLAPKVLIKGASLSLNLNASRNFHQFETDKTGAILNQYGLREILSASYSIQKWTLSTDFIFRHGWNYEGSVGQSFEHSQEAAYAVSPMWTVTLGHTNSGSWLAPNGQDSNFKLINENDSEIYVSTSVVF